jgi:hypothetical protein
LFALRYLNVPPSEPAALAAKKSKSGVAAPSAGESQRVSEQVAASVEGPGSDLLAFEPEADGSSPPLDDEDGSGADAPLGDDEGESADQDLEFPAVGSGRSGQVAVGSNSDEGREAPPAKAEVVGVPSFRGMTMGQAIRAARRVGLELALEGSGVAVAQSPKTGAVRRGSICRVQFRPGG